MQIAYKIKPCYKNAVQLHDKGEFCFIWVAVLGIKTVVEPDFSLNSIWESTFVWNMTNPAIVLLCLFTFLCLLFVYCIQSLWREETLSVRLCIPVRMLVLSVITAYFFSKGPLYLIPDQFVLNRETAVKRLQSKAKFQAFLRCEPCD